jgi:hypothetical protein
MILALRGRRAISPTVGIRLHGYEGRIWRRVLVLRYRPDGACQWLRSTLNSHG